MMENTIMPVVKEQIQQLGKSSMVTIYHSKNVTTCFRSHVVPNTIRPRTIAFKEDAAVTEDDTPTATMTFAYGGEGDATLFGSVKIDDPCLLMSHTSNSLPR